MLKALTHADVTETWCKTVAEEYANEQAHSDSEVFRKIRLRHKEGDEDGEKQWWARLSDSTRDDLSMLLRDKRYEKAFDAMLPWPGLWADISPSSLRKRKGKFDEVGKSNLALEP